MASVPSTVERVELDGRPVWVKRYGSGSRVARLRVMDWVARRLGIEALRPPPHRDAAAAKQVERTRLAALAAAGVRVPDVVGEGESLLILSDLGETLSSRLRSEPAPQAQALVADAERLLAVSAARLSVFYRSPAGEPQMPPAPKRMRTRPGARSPRSRSTTRSSSALKIVAARALFIG